METETNVSELHHKSNQRFDAVFRSGNISTLMADIEIPKIPDRLFFRIGDVIDKEHIGQQAIRQIR